MAFGTIMLNTDAHNSNVTDKMTQKQFIDNIHYIQGGESIPTLFLEDLYERIVHDEIKFNREDIRFLDAMKTDTIFLHGSGNKWHKRYAVLTKTHLLLFKKQLVRSGTT